MKPRGPRKSPLKRFLGKVEPELPAKGCWLWIGSKDAYGYGLIEAMGEYRAHRLAWRLFRGDFPKELKVLHKCDVTSCVNPEHLFLGTQAQNVADMWAKGRQGSGHRREGHCGVKLSMAAIAQMKEQRKSGLFFYQIAKEFGVSTTAAHRAITGRSWR